jgi:hypothetical protein
VLCIADTFTFTPVAFVSLVWHKKDLEKRGKKNASLGEHQLETRITRMEQTEQEWNG